MNESKSNQEVAHVVPTEIQEALVRFITNMARPRTQQDIDKALSTIKLMRDEFNNCFYFIYRGELYETTEDGFLYYNSVQLVDNLERKVYLLTLLCQALLSR